jgi:hypothetical protein
VLSFEVKGGRAAAWRVIDLTRLVSLTANLGDVKTTIIHPASTTHSRISPEARAAAGISEGLVRLAVGLEAVSDLKADLERGLDPDPDRGGVALGVCLETPPKSRSQVPALGWSWRRRRWSPPPISRAAKLALLVAIPPGYATAIWPGSGIALAALLLGGARLWPGVLVGSLPRTVTIEGSILAAAVIARRQHFPGVRRRRADAAPARRAARFGGVRTW